MSPRTFKPSLTSCSVFSSSKSVNEASKVRVSNLGLISRFLSFFWEIPIQVVTYTAGQLLSSQVFTWLKKRR
jgi:hypothetical protein